MLTRDWLNAFVAIGSTTEDQTAWQAAGAGVLVLSRELLWIVTARHVLESIGRHKISALVGSKKDRQLVVVEFGSIHEASGIEWITNSERDLAISLMPFSEDLEIRAVAEPYFLPISEATPSMPCYTVGCPYGVRSFDPGRANPIVLDGIVSAVDERNSTLYTTTPTFRGNSGGPLIVVRSPFNPSGGIVVGKPTILLAGIVLGSTTVSEPVEAAGEPPLRLGACVSIDAVRELLGSEEAIAQAARVTSQ